MKGKSYIWDVISRVKIMKTEERKKVTLEPGDEGYWGMRAKQFKKEYRKSRWERKAFTGPDQLFELACEYFHRVDNSPFLKQDFIKSGESAGKVVELKNVRPYTWCGLEAYLFEKGYISTLQDYKANTQQKYNDYIGVIRVLEKIMYDQKFSGATVGAFNATIISRDLGLVDQSKVTVAEEQPLFGEEPADSKED